METNHLSHHGIIGMKWGVRRYQNKDGSLTAAGRKRAGAGKKNDPRKQSIHKNKKRPPAANTKPKEKSVKELSDTELRERINRLELEKRYSSLNPKQVSLGRRILNDVIEPAAKDAGKRLLTDFAIEQGKNLLGLKDLGDPEFDKLKKEVDVLRLQSQKATYMDKLSKK